MIHPYKTPWLHCSGKIGRIFGWFSMKKSFYFSGWRPTIFTAKKYTIIDAFAFFKRGEKKKKIVGKCESRRSKRKRKKHPTYLGFAARYNSLLPRQKAIYSPSFASKSSFPTKKKKKKRKKSSSATFSVLVKLRLFNFRLEASQRCRLTLRRTLKRGLPLSRRLTGKAQDCRSNTG